MINMSVGWYLGILAGGAGLGYILGYFCGRIDGKVR